MTVIARLPDGRIIATASSSGPTSYSAGGFDITVGDVKAIDQVIAIFNDGGYLTEPASVSDNTVTVKVYYFDYDATADGAATEASGNLSTVTFTVVVIGH